MTIDDLKQKLLFTDLVINNEYLDKYCKLLFEVKLNTYDSSKANYHHAIPRMYYESKNLAIDNSDDNVFILLYKDHVLAHYYLAMAAKNSDFKYKMAYAVRFIIGQITEESEKLLLEKLPEVQASYELAATDFSINNPSKKPANAKKISEKRKGKIYIKKDNISKIIDPKELDTYIELGWERGRVGNWKNVNKNKICIIYNNQNKYVDESELDYYLSLGAKKGGKKQTIVNKGNRGKMSKESREKQAKSRRGKIAVHNTTTNKIVYIDKADLLIYEQLGYILGTGLKPVGTAGKIWIHNETEEKYINKNELSLYVKMNYTQGRLTKRKEVMYNE